jgi:hypothetical protein
MEAAAAVEAHQRVGRQQLVRHDVVMGHLQRRLLLLQLLMMLRTAVLCTWHQKMLRHGRECTSSCTKDEREASCTPNPYLNGQAQVQCALEIGLCNTCLAC